MGLTGEKGVKGEMGIRGADGIQVFVKFFKIKYKSQLSVKKFPNK